MKTTVKQMANFVHQHYPLAGTWNTKALQNWLSWAVEQGFLFTVGDNNKLVGLAMIRPTMNPQQCLNTLNFDSEGDCYFVDMAIALPPKRDVLQAIGFAVIKRFGQRDKIAFQRQGLGPIIVRDAKEDRRKLMRILQPTGGH